MPFCESCGQQVDPSSKFCASCGARQIDDDQGDERPAPRVAGQSPRNEERPDESGKEQSDEQAPRFARNKGIVDGKLARTPRLMSPGGGVYYVGDMRGDDWRLDDKQDVLYSKRGFPQALDGESELGRWVVMNVKPAGSVNGVWWDEAGPAAGEFFQGELNVVLTDRAIRAASSVGEAQGYGKLDRGWTCFAFTIPVAKIDWIAAGRRAVVLGTDEPAMTIAAKSYEVADASWHYKGGLRNDNAMFAAAVTMSVARAQSDHIDPARRQRAQQILAMGVGGLSFDRRGRPAEFRFDR